VILRGIATSWPCLPSFWGSIMVKMHFKVFSHVFTFPYQRLPAPRTPQLNHKMATAKNGFRQNLMIQLGGPGGKELCML